MSNETDFTFEAHKRYTGRVKWFNNKSGFGFVTVHDSTKRTPNDIFVHHSAIHVLDQQFRYLIQGEYIEFTIEPVIGKTHAFQAAGVTGISKDILMCENRNDLRQQKSEYLKTKK